MQHDTGTGAPDLSAMIPEVKVPAGLTLAGLVGGLVLGLLVGEGGGLSAMIAPLGHLWLRALQMTILPLVVSLLVTGIVQSVAAAEAGPMARRTLGLFVAVLGVGTVMAAVLMPLALDLFPVPQRAAAALQAAAPAASGSLPAFADFLDALLPANVVAAAAGDLVLPVLAFFALFAMATTRLPAAPRDLMANVFAALAATMMVIIGWVLRLAPVGVFALALGVSSAAGSDAIAALAHYIAVVASMGAIVFVAGYGLAVLGGRLALGAFARTMLPVQAMALSTQSSLACLPAMLAACRSLGVRSASADFVLPLAVALFRATSPVMNLAVGIYVARLTGTPLPPAAIAAGVAVAVATTFGTISLPGTISFIASTAPIALAMGVPTGPLGLLVAVEMLPDLMRTLANVTMDVAVTATVDRRSRTA
ncbi:cation:dicarboxylase symporter family transporter [Novosphingobium flavum]|uniref:Cation:dicarboxylase symporter family transporter n=1 Tax=Novosphingobium flavum TaxID=1778672 RepID=A0A7X1KKA6_9SPHN|nr:cation:dicarboxylase symporter family transporter [Novosphingobium flavum]MBC2664331.1 cation:dicarboxylase symporter family transporter [Novosphingobium flavum]